METLSNVDAGGWVENTARGSLIAILEKENLCPSKHHIQKFASTLIQLL